MMPIRNLWLFPVILVAGFFILAVAALIPGPWVGMGASSVKLFALLFGPPMFVTGLIFTVWMFFKRR